MALTLYEYLFPHDQESDVNVKGNSTKLVVLCLRGNVLVHVEDRVSTAATLSNLAATPSSALSRVVQCAVDRLISSLNIDSNNVWLEHMLEAPEEKSTWRRSWKGFKHMLPIPHTNDEKLMSMKQYYGSSIAYYFSWTQYYSNSLICPTVFGLVVWYYYSPGRFTVGKVAFSVFMSVWLTLFTEFWQRRSNSLAYSWKVLSMDRNNVERSIASQNAKPYLWMRKIASWYLLFSPSVYSFVC